MDKSRLATIIFDSGVKIPESEFNKICECIEKDTFTLNEFVLKYKKKEELYNSYFFILDDSSRVLISESTISILQTANLDRNKLESFMQTNKKNFEMIVEGIYGNP